MSLAIAEPERSPVISSHASAQAYIRAWFRRYRQEHWQVKKCRVEFNVKKTGLLDTSACVVTVHFSHLVPHLGSYRSEDNHQQFSYDLAQGVTEAILSNRCLVMTEPYEAWMVKDSRWKGELQ